MKRYENENGSYKFLHKDYIGSVLAISDEVGNKLEQRHYDAWGNFTHLKIGNEAVVTDKSIIAGMTLLIDRGYTSHEHLMNVGIIHMNGRLYDPLLRRFLNADENIQEPTNTQNYNKYGYVMNNPLMYNDPSGEYLQYIIGAIVGGYLNGVAANNGNWNPVKWDWQKSWGAVVGGAIGGAAVSGALGNISSNAGAIKNVLPGLVSGGLNSAFNGGNFLGGAIGGVSYSESLSYNKVTSSNLYEQLSRISEYDEANAFYDILYYDFLFRKDGSSILKDQLSKNYQLTGSPDLSSAGLDKMVNITPELKRLYELGGKSAKFNVVKGIPTSRAGGVTLGETLGLMVNLSRMDILNNWDLALTIGHEFIHVYHNVKYRSEWMRTYKDTSSNKYKIISEIEAHTWSKMMGDPSADENLRFYREQAAKYKIFNYKPINAF
ncbi:RHS repeat-associated core domain-containing protein [Chryseobacterium sp.]|uniref:RHS repeat domain-containing protein n=1 Tax=Chryseobacterium sp. TaxID=1871047 RepID=UPI00289AEA56|nr:RHS repeat-associated core domain-containing protein [Chryseobacterium sp.]